MTGRIGVFLVLPGLLALSVRADPLPRRVVPPPGIPSFLQTDPAAGLPNGGRMYCAPAAVSNSLAMLFAAELKEQGLAQVGLIKLLASNGYMYTHPQRGTRAPTTGRIVGASPDYEFPAKLIHQLTSGLPVKRRADCALLDAVVILQIPGRSAIGL